MPFKRRGSPFWQVWPRISGYGRVGPWSTGTRDRARALAIEAMLRELPFRGHGDVLKLLRAGEVTLREVYVHHLEGRLPEMVARAADPDVCDVVAAMLGQVTDERVRTGFRDLLELLPAGARLSYLREPKNVEDLLHARQAQGLRRNSVRRSMYRAISDLLDRELGAAEKSRVLSEVHFPTEKDERTVTLRPDQVARLMDAVIDPLFECFLGLAITTGIDRGPLLAIRPRHFDDEHGELVVVDGKTEARPRTLELPAPAAAYLRRAIMLRGVALDEIVFPWTIHQVRKHFEAAAERAGLRAPRGAEEISPEAIGLRFKDLRSVYAEAFVEAGGTLKDLQAWLGHADGKTSLRYTRSQPVRLREAAERAAKVLGFGRHLKAAKEAG